MPSLRRVLGLAILLLVPGVARPDEDVAAVALRYRDHVRAGEAWAAEALEEHLDDLDPDALARAGRALLGSAASRPEVDAAVARLMEAGDLGSPVALVGLGLHFLRGVPSLEAYGRDGAMGREFLTQAAQAGSVEARRHLGVALMVGAGGPRDPVRGTRWLVEAASAGDAEAREALERHTRTVNRAQGRFHAHLPREVQDLVPPGRAVWLGFTQDRCPLCKIHDPEVRRVLPAHPEVLLRWVDVQSGPGRAAAQALKVHKTPTSILYGPAGEVLMRRTGPIAAGDIESVLGEHEL